MKFAKELEQELVPEWRIKYLNYKAGKKHVKAVARAISRANTTPVLRRHSDYHYQTPRFFPSGSPFSARRPGGRAAGANTNNAGAGDHSGSGVSPATEGGERLSLRSSPAPLGQSKPAGSPGVVGPRRNTNTPARIDEEAEAEAETRSLTAARADRRNYGSIVGPSHGRSASVSTAGSRIFEELPAPALRMPSNLEEPRAAATASAGAAAGGAASSAKPSATSTYQAIGVGGRAQMSPSMRSASVALPGPRASSGAGVGLGSGAGTVVVASGRHAPLPPAYTMTPTQRIRRMLSSAAPQQWLGSGPGSGSGPGAGLASPAAGDDANDISLRALDEVRERQLEFFQFLDGELDKVETFYKLKEEQASLRLVLLREQLHEMRNRRISEIQQARRRIDDDLPISPGSSGDEGRGPLSGGAIAGVRDGADGAEQDTAADVKGWDVQQDWIAPLRAKIFKPGPNSKALQHMQNSPRLAVGGGRRNDARRDYVRRPGDHDIPYRTAKHKLKLALQEFYRGLELLKSYALLNRTAFRKLNKKYDKAVNARPPYRYMNEKVNRTWFVNSTVVDDLIVAVEDLYARYFERGNHKIAAGKLRALTRRPGDESGSAFRNGVMVGLGVVFAVQGTVHGAQQLFVDDPVRAVQASYLLQIYGGYFLMLYLFTLFCLDCHVWTTNKINYPFIFEFDPRSHLDWRQLAQFPSFFFLVLGLFMWLNFSDAANPRLYLYYPVILIALTVALLFLPAPTLWHRSRRWFLYSHWRLFFAGLYPVEFRDFFLGDIYCSLIYSACNVELFFCLYAHAWNDPAQCNSNHSRLLGFFSTLPPIWRLLQCFRRYYDTRNVFPHLVNGGKYSMTILSYVTLSLYRIHESHANLALFITFSAINSVYSSFWDLFMDFSLLQAGSRHFLLRDILALKQRWVYYTIMVLDPLLRFSWIFYAIFTHDTQHNSLCSFLVSFGEATRRGMWAIVRLENEHCANVAQYKASRDVPLPYHLHEADSIGQVPLLAGDVPSSRRATTAAAPAGDGTSMLGDAVAIVSPPGRATIAGSIRSTQAPRARQGTAASTAADVWPDLERNMTAASAAAVEDAAVPGVSGVADTSGAAAATSGAEQHPAAAEMGLLRRRFTTTLGKSIGILMAEAHKQDFEKKRKPGMDASPMGRPGAVNDLASSDEDEDEDHGNGHGDDDDDDGDDYAIVDDDDDDEGGGNNSNNNNNNAYGEGTPLQPAATAGSRSHRSHRSHRSGNSGPSPHLR